MLIELLDNVGILLGSALVASTPLLLTATGELVTEKSGVLNLGAEGMMLIGAVSGFAISYFTNSNFLGVTVAMLIVVLFSFLFSFLTQVLATNHVATGLALTIFGTGLSALIGKSFIGLKLEQINKIEIPFLSEIPLFGPFLFKNDIIVYLAVIICLATGYFLQYTRAGLILLSVGDNHNVSHSLGYKVRLIRFGAISYGAALAGMSGAYLSLAYTPQWTEGMTAGRGWIALALVVFSSWRSARLMIGAYLFGIIQMSQLYFQAMGIPISSQLLSMAPYLATIVVLTIISLDSHSLKLNIPHCLGKSFIKV